MARLFINFMTLQYVEILCVNGTAHLYTIQSNLIEETSKKVKSVF